LETDVFLDSKTANQFVIKGGELYSVNAIAAQWPGKRVPDGEVFRGTVVDWRWCCSVGGRSSGLLQPGEVRAARHFGLIRLIR